MSPIRNYEPTRLEPDLRPLGFRRFTVREENQKQLMVEIEHLETAGCQVKFEAPLLTSLNIGNPRESAATSCSCVIPCGALKSLEKL